MRGNRANSAATLATGLLAVVSILWPFPLWASVAILVLAVGNLRWAISIARAADADAIGDNHAR